MRTTLLRLVAIGIGAMLLTSAFVHIPSSTTMEKAAKNFLASLTPEQREQATYKFEDDQRFDWHFIPKPRKGLPLKDMTSYQTKLAHALLAAGLSQQGYIKAVSIMSLEDVLKVMEKDAGQRRNPDGYFFTIFGEPSSTGVWGYRVEGHHVSQNYTVVGGKVMKRFAEFLRFESRGSEGRAAQGNPRSRSGGRDGPRGNQVARRRSEKSGDPE